MGDLAQVPRDWLCLAVAGIWAMKQQSGDLCVSVCLWVNKMAIIRILEGCGLDLSMTVEVCTWLGRAQVCLCPLQAMGGLPVRHHWPEPLLRSLGGGVQR